MAVVVKTTDQFDASTGIKVMVYGKAGSGKTTLCASAPRPFIISAESGLMSLRKFKIPYTEVNTLPELEEVLTWAENPYNNQHFDTLCIDSVSEIFEVAIAGLKRSKPDPRQAYGELVDTYLPKLKRLRDLRGKHVIVTAKMGQMKDEVTGSLLFAPDAPGRELPKQMPYIMDLLFYMGTDVTPQGQAYRFLRTQPNFQFEAKDRSGSLAEIERPDLTYIFNKIRG
jgi:hypothetical protein